MSHHLYNVQEGEYTPAPWARREDGAMYPSIHRDPPKRVWYKRVWPWLLLGTVIAALNSHTVFMYVGAAVLIVVLFWVFIAGGFTPYDDDDD